MWEVDHKSKWHGQCATCCSRLLWFTEIRWAPFSFLKLQCSGNTKDLVVALICSIIHVMMIWGDNKNPMCSGHKCKGNYYLYWEVEMFPDTSSCFLIWTCDGNTKGNHHIALKHVTCELNESVSYYYVSCFLSQRSFKSWKCQCVSVGVSLCKDLCTLSATLSFRVNDFIKPFGSFLFVTLWMIILVSGCMDLTFVTVTCIDSLPWGHLCVVEVQWSRSWKQQQLVLCSLLRAASCQDVDTVPPTQNTIPRQMCCSSNQEWRHTLRVPFKCLLFSRTSWALWGLDA